MLAKRLIASHFIRWEEKETNVEIINAFLTGLYVSLRYFNFFNVSVEYLYDTIMYISVETNYINSINIIIEK